MQVTLEQVIAEARALHPAERAQLRRWLDEQVAPKVRQVRADSAQERQVKALQWLEENRRQYVGQWVALDGDKLIAAGKDRRKFVAEVRASNVKAPFIHKFVCEELPFGGW